MSADEQSGPTTSVPTTNGIADTERAAIVAAEPALLKAALAKADAGQTGDAIELLTTLANAGSVRPDVYHALALIHEAEGALVPAVRHLQTAATLELTGTAALRDLVRLYIAGREYGKAIGCLALIVQRDGVDDTLLDVVTRLLCTLPASATDLDWLSPELSARRDSPSPPPQAERNGNVGAPPAPVASPIRLAEADSRLAFLIHSEELLNHYRGVCRLLAPGSFVFVVQAAGAELATIIDAVRREGWTALSGADALAEGRRFRALVSNHPLTSDDPPLIKRLGDINVRFMYAAGKSGWNLREWNRLYDVILCFGPYHAEAFSRTTDAVILQMGYPRFDSCFDTHFNRDETARRFGCDPDRPTVVWLPTWSTLSSVGLYDEAMADLADRYNVVVKVHPLMPTAEPEKVNKLEQLGFARVIRNATDNAPLYGIADFVVCDYGGPAFGALYTDRNLLLLDVPAADGDELLGSDSTEGLLRQSLIHIESPTACRLADLFANQDLWRDQAKARAKLRRQFFAPYFGFAAQVAATILSNLDAVVRSNRSSPPW